MRYSDVKYILGGLILQIVATSWIGDAHAAPASPEEMSWRLPSYLTITTGTGGIPYVEQAELGAPPANSGNYHFGDSVAAWYDIASGTTWLVAGASDENNRTGAAYVFSRSSPDAPWHQEARLTANDGHMNQFFGAAVAIENTTIVVTAIGSGNGVAYTFDRDTGTGQWTQRTTELSVSGVSSFGDSVVLTNGTLAIGAPNKDNGYVFLYVPSGTSWMAIATLTAPDAPTGAEFGASLSLDSNRLLIGAAGDSRIGSAYVFAYDSGTGTWNFQWKLIPVDGAANDSIGYSVALQGNNALIGAIGRDSGRGAVINFLFDSGRWNQQPTLQAADGVAGDRFGSSLTLMGSSVAIGAWARNGYAGAI